MNLTCKLIIVINCLCWGFACVCLAALFIPIGLYLSKSTKEKDLYDTHVDKSDEFIVMMEWGIGLGVVGSILLIPGLIGTCYYQRKEVRQLQGESTPSSRPRSNMLHPVSELPLVDRNEAAPHQERGYSPVPTSVPVDPSAPSEEGPPSYEEAMRMIRKPGPE